MVCADVVGSHAATPRSSHGQHLPVHSVSPSHYAEPSSIERQFTLVGKLFDSKIAEIKAIPDSNILDSTIEASSLSSEQEYASYKPIYQFLDEVSTLKMRLCNKLHLSKLLLPHPMKIVF